MPWVAQGIPDLGCRRTRLVRLRVGSKGLHLFILELLLDACKALEYGPGVHHILQWLHEFFCESPHSLFGPCIYIFGLPDEYLGISQVYPTYHAEPFPKAMQNTDYN